MHNHIMYIVHLFVAHMHLKILSYYLTLILDSTRLRSDIEALGNLISKTDALICLSIKECGLNDQDN